MTAKMETEDVLRKYHCALNFPFHLEICYWPQYLF